MRSQLKLMGAAALAGILLAGHAEAKGCLKGAAVGAVAGHYAGHHAVLGAITGCVVGRHMANKKAREEEAARAKTAPQH
ncbi:MAG: hypothetical protein JOZ55_08340 [Alphaproteobacteria bacterium]|nr:hypothetical protein [Alphaproteobacteria bacterium]